jgi:dUTP pyrophosphatase
MQQIRKELIKKRSLMSNVNIKLDVGAFMPERAHETDAGADIRTPYGFMLEPHSQSVVHTGVHIETPHGYASVIKSKSGLNIKHDIISDGLVDEGFDGEILVKLYNLGSTGHYFNRGDKITQIVIVPVEYAEFTQVDEIAGGERGSDGYGSTGR